MKKKLNITYMAFDRVHYDSFDYGTPFEEIHFKLYRRCNTYHITQVHSPDDHLLDATPEWSIIKFFKKLLTPKK